MVKREDTKGGWVALAREINEEWLMRERGRERNVRE